MKRFLNKKFNQRKPSSGRPNLYCLRITYILILLLQIPPGTTQLSKAMIYLSKYGYLPASDSNPTSGKLITEESFSRAISEFQNFAGLNVTGILDSETMKLMQTPRCGVKDTIGNGSFRSKRYALQGSRWKVKDLAYKISKYPRNLKSEEVDTVIKKAFNVWSDHTDLTFTQKREGSVHIEIRFERGEHGDGDPFDGRGGTLAHAYFPIYGGDAHFDDDEAWSVKSYTGTNLFQVAAHEFGHSLGLSHSEVRNALMAPYYKGFDPYFELHKDDIEGIQALYGKKSKKIPMERPKTIFDDPELCSLQMFDTIFTDADKAMYVFKKDKYWELTEEGLAPGYPKLISKSWPGLPSNIDTAFTYKSGKTYFFKGNQYWRFTGKEMDMKYPRRISEGFAGIPDNLDAVMQWGGNGKIYFFKGSKYWKFDPSVKPSVKSIYPKPISSWKGIPNNLDGALQYVNGFTYFFKQDAYWRFNDFGFQVDSDTIPYPRSVKYWWYGCRKASKGTLGKLLVDRGFVANGSVRRLQEDHESMDEDVILEDGGDFDPSFDVEKVERANPDDNSSSNANISTLVFVIPFVLCFLD